MSISGDQAINLNKAKKSLLVCSSTGTPKFSNNTKVKDDKATDTVNSGIEFKAKTRWSQGGTNTRLPIQLVGNREKNKKAAVDTDPDGGTLSLTLTDESWMSEVQVQVGVNYVNDDDK